MNNNFFKLFIALLLSVSFNASSSEYSKTGVVGGFDGPKGTLSSGINSVASIGNIWINNYVTLEGNITRQIRENYYKFQDNTGEIMIEIARVHFGSQTITPETKVNIHGEVSLGFRGKYIYVDSLRIIK